MSGCCRLFHSVALLCHQCKFEWMKHCTLVKAIHHWMHHYCFNFLQSSKVYSKKRPPNWPSVESFQMQQRVTNDLYTIITTCACAIRDVCTWVLPSLEVKVPCFLWNLHCVKLIFVTYFRVVKLWFTARASASAAAPDSPILFHARLWKRELQN